jgi:hypothetical protein
MFHLDYLSCFLTVLATILLARKSWTGLLIAIVNSLIVCAIALRASQLGLIPANLFCICVYGFSMRSWLKKQSHTSRDQAQRQDSGSVADGPQMELRLPDTDAVGLQRLGALVWICETHRSGTSGYGCSDSIGQRSTVQEMPLTLLIDRQDRIAYSHAGVVDKGSFERDIEALLTTTR